VAVLATRVLEEFTAALDPVAVTAERGDRSAYAAGYICCGGVQVRV
jgi:hypothetical protein